MQGAGNKIMNKLNQEALIEFNPKLPKLTKSEKAVLKLLVEAGRLISPLYLEQEGQARQVLNKKEIEEAAKKDPTILSPYTVIEKIKGKIIATPYNIKYINFLKPIADKLIEASKITENKRFANFLKLQAKALTGGNYEKAIAAGLKMKPYKIDISIGPLDYFNRLFEGKAVYQAWVGVMDAEGTKRLNNYKSIVYNASRKTLEVGERIENSHFVKAKTIDEIILSGLMARSRFVGLNLPMDVNLVEKYGSEVTIFNQVNNLRMKEEILPTFKEIFSPAFQKEFNTEDLRRSSLRYVALHELAHNYLYYRDAAKNLQELFPAVYELTATLLGMRIAGSLLLKDRLTDKQLESMIVAFICRSFNLIEQSKKEKIMVNYARGGSIFINFMLERGALIQKAGMAIPNFTKIFLSMHELSYKIEHLLSSGSKEEAEAFFNKFSRLSKIT